jgi:hypothetical protein
MQAYDKAMQAYDNDESMDNNEELIIEINTPTEAKLAFIYSEIFNRRYS